MAVTRASKRRRLRRVKNISIIVGAVLLTVGVWSLVAATRSSHTSDKLQVLTTFTVLADIASNVAGEHAEVNSITKPGAEIHGYEPTPQDVARMEGADVVLDNGLGLESWAEKLYQNVPTVPHITLTDNIAAIDLTEGAYKDKPNPHAWMSPANALLYVDTIEKTLSAYDPANAAGYKENATAYKAQIAALDATLRTEVAELPASHRYLVTCEGAFSYLTDNYGLQELYLWPVNSETEGTPQQIRQVVETVKEHSIPVVFCESTVNDKAQQQVVKETGARFGGLFYVDSLSDADGPTPTYLKLLDYNVHTFLNAMKEATS